MKIYYFALYALLGLSLLSCETEININDQWEDVTVIYGLLNGGSGSNYIRIERGYLGTEPARASVNIPDSLYYDSLVVNLYGLNDQGDTLYESELQRDNSATRDTGLFTSEDFRLYRTDKRLVPNLTDHLRVIKPGTNYPDATASTELVGHKVSDLNGFRFRTPRDFNFVTPEYNGNIEWYPSERAEMYEVDIYFHYKEMDRTTKEVVNKSIKIDFETQMGPFQSSSSGPIPARLGRTALYERIASQVPVDPNKLRFYDKMRIEVWAGGENLRRYIQLNQPSSGLSQTKPEFTQVKNGTGLLSSRARIAVNNVQLSTGTGGLASTYYLDPALCDRRFAIAETRDTCICEFVGNNDTRKLCL